MYVCACVRARVHACERGCMCFVLAFRSFKLSLPCLVFATQVIKIFSFFYTNYCISYIIPSLPNCIYCTVEWTMLALVLFSTIVRMLVCHSSVRGSSQNRTEQIYISPTTVQCTNSKGDITKNQTLLPVKII